MDEPNGGEPNRDEPDGAESGSAESNGAVLALISDAYVCIAAGGKVIQWNPAAHTTFGWTREQAIGRDACDLIVPERLRAAYRAGLRRLTLGDPGGTLGRRIQLTAMHSTGYELPIELTLAAEGTGREQVFHVLAHDATALLRDTRFTMVEAAISGGLAEAPSSTEAAVRVVEALGQRMGWPVAELWLADDQRRRLTCAARHNRAGRDLSGFAFDELEFGAGLPGEVLESGNPRWLTDSAGFPGGLHMAVGVPILSGPRVMGALCVYGDRAEERDDLLVRLLSGLAARVGSYLERRRAEELAIDLARTKDEFLSLVTHELRNPLFLISGAVELLTDELEEISTDDLRDQLRLIGSNAQRLNLMAGDLLDLASLESGRLDIRTASIDLCAVLSESLSTTRTAFEAKQLTVRTELPGRLMLCGDADRLRQVADNLLSNAAKYTPQGGVVTITAGPDNADPGWVTWTVSDTGIGIPVEERPRLFRRFYRASTAVKSRIPGTGLGLVITRTIIERHHGTIGIADTAGPGTTFAIRLPRGEIFTNTAPTTSVRRSLTPAT